MQTRRTQAWVRAGMIGCKLFQIALRRSPRQIDGTRVLLAPYFRSAGWEVSDLTRAN